MLLVVVSFASLASLVCSDSLLSVIVIHRHGDRNPLKSYKTDPYKAESHWPEGFGQLTKRGLQRQYELGLWLRERYNSFLPPRYSKKNVRVISTDVDRTLMSAEVALAGLYPPTETEKWHQNINWRPVPIHTTPQTKDPLLAMRKPCKKYKRLFEDLLASKQVTEMNEINRDLFRFLSEKSGENVTSVMDVEVIHNALHTQALANKTIPEWAAEVYPEKLKASVLLKYKLPCYTRELARLRTGLLFGEIVRHFQDAPETSTNDHPKLLVFSGHDSTLSDVLTTMGAFGDEVPPYSSAVIMELSRNETDRYVNVFFKNDEGLHNITLEMCDFDCGLGDFVGIFENVVQSDVLQWEKECENL